MKNTGRGKPRVEPERPCATSDQTDCQQASSTTLPLINLFASVDSVDVTASMMESEPLICAILRCDPMPTTPNRVAMRRTRAGNDHGNAKYAVYIVQPSQTHPQTPMILMD